eukprot:2552147-Amphidinium_carterae.1
MLTHLRSYYNEGLLTCADAIPSFIDFFDEHGSEYSRHWRLLLRWLSYQDVDNVIGKFNHALMLRGEEIDVKFAEEEQDGEEREVPSDREDARCKSGHKKKEKKVEKKPKGGQEPPDEEPE